MDGVAQANYALSYMANVGIQQQPWPAKDQQVKDEQKKDAGAVGAVEMQVPGIGTDVRPEDAGAKVMRSVDGDTVTISAEGQAYVQEAAAAVNTPDVASATARVEDSDRARIQPAEDKQAERPEETRFDRPQGGGIERAEFERPEVQQIQDNAEKTREAERTAPQFRVQEEEQPKAVEEAAAEEEEAAEEIDPSDFRQYFNSELRQMLYRGQITQQQYEKEIESRKTEDDMKIDKKVI